MLRRKATLGIVALCVIALGAFAASSASAAKRAYLCAANTVFGQTQFLDSHCTVAAEPTDTGLKHELIIGGKKIKITNVNTASGTTAAALSSLKGALSGVETEIQCTAVEGEGELTNTETSVSGTATAGYSGCSVTKPSGKGCKVKGGAVTTKELSATTVGQTENNVQFTPKSGTEFASIPIEGCSVESLNNTFPVTGSLVATAAGATLTTVHAAITVQNALKFGGVKAGLNGTVTVKTSTGTIAAIGLT